MVIEEEKAKRVETKETSIAKSKSRQAAITSMLHSLFEKLDFCDLLFELQPYSFKV